MTLPRLASVVLMIGRRFDDGDRFGHRADREHRVHLRRAVDAERHLLTDVGLESRQFDLDRISPRRETEELEDALLTGDAGAGSSGRGIGRRHCCARNHRSLRILDGARQRCRPGLRVCIRGNTEDRGNHQHCHENPPTGRTSHVSPPLRLNQGLPEQSEATGAPVLKCGQYMTGWDDWWDEILRLRTGVQAPEG